MNKIWVTWHREKYFNDESKAFFLNKIDELLTLISQSGKEVSFNLWGANWVDNWFGKACLKHSIPVNLYLPYWTEKSQSSKLSYEEFIDDNSKQLQSWSEEQISELYEIYASPMTNVSSFWKWYHVRDREIVDNATQYIYTIFFWNEKSWTWYTLNYARSKDKTIINLDNLNGKHT